MTIQVSSVTNNQSFGVWLRRVNQMATLFTSNTVTVNFATTGSLTTGNATVNGFFQSNVFAVQYRLRGGTMDSPNNLIVGTNAYFYNTSDVTVMNVSTNSTTSHVTLNPNNVSLTPSHNTSIGGTRLNITAQVANLTSVNFNLNTVISQVGNVSLVSSNGSMDVLAVVSNSTVAQVVANSTHLVLRGTETSLLGTNLSASYTLANLSISTIEVNSATALRINSANTSIYGGNVAVNNSLSIAQGISVSSLYRQSANSYTSAGTSPEVADAFPGATFASAEYLVQMEYEADSKRQLSRVLLVHDGSDAFVTEYGVITTNGAVGTISANLNSGTVELVITTLNSGTKVVIKRTLLHDT